jgi:hypothetical protein
MILKVSSIVNAGEPERERVVLRATADGDVGEYAIFRANADADGDALSGDVPNVFWFPGSKVKAGDLVVLYTKRGTRRNKVLDESGATTHFFYWGKPEALWNNAK